MIYTHKEMKGEDQELRKIEGREKEVKNRADVMGLNQRPQIA